MRWRTLRALCGALILSSVSTAQAAFSPVSLPIFNEDTHQEIFSHVYGSPFVPSGLNYTNGSITAVRVDDAVDQIWQDFWESANVKAIFAANDQKFGYKLGDSGGSFVELINATGEDYAVTGSANLTSVSAQTLRWVRAGDGFAFSSKPTENTDGKDHMVTYQIQGLTDGKKTFFLFFEDLATGEPTADFDYQDLVIKLTAIPEPEANVPEPTSLGLLALGGMMLAARKRR